jgi:cytochrome P450
MVQTTGGGVPTYPHDIFTDEVLSDPHPHYRALRELGPVVWLEAHGMYALPRYAQARAALADPGIFCSGRGVGLNDVINGLAAGGNTLTTDGEVHDHLRGVIGPGLTPRALRGIRASVEQQASDLVAGLARRGSFDAVTDLARALPLSVVPDLIGLPAGGRDRLLEWAAASFDLMGPFNARAEQAFPKVAAMIEFASRTAIEGDVVPGGLGAAIIDAVTRGELGLEQAPLVIVDYLAPSLDTTISAIGSAVWLLATHPGQWAALKADPTLAANAFNEVVRLESPIRAFSRVTTADTTVAGHRLAEGSRVMILFASANRDEQVFTDAERFDITRGNAAEHIGFGYGAHGCAGQGLARLEGHAVLRALVTHIGAMELGQPVRAMNNLISAFTSLPLRVQPTRPPAGTGA